MIILSISLVGIKRWSGNVEVVARDDNLINLSCGDKFQTNGWDPIGAERDARCNSQKLIRKRIQWSSDPGWRHGYHHHFICAVSCLHFFYDSAWVMNLESNMICKCLPFFDSAIWVFVWSAFFHLHWWKTAPIYQDGPCLRTKLAKHCISIGQYSPRPSLIVISI